MRAIEPRFVEKAINPTVIRRRDKNAPAVASEDFVNINTMVRDWRERPVAMDRHTAEALVKNTLATGLYELDISEIFAGSERLKNSEDVREMEIRAAKLAELAEIPLTENRTNFLQNLHTVNDIFRGVLRVVNNFYSRRYTELHRHAPQRFAESAAGDSINFLREFLFAHRHNLNERSGYRNFYFDLKDSLQKSAFPILTPQIENSPEGFRIMRDISLGYREIDKLLQQLPDPDRVARRRQAA